MDSSVLYRSKCSSHDVFVYTSIFIDQNNMITLNITVMQSIEPKI